MQVMRGYLNNADATNATIRQDGFMHTGDIAKFDDDGWLYITDRWVRAPLAGTLSYFLVVGVTLQVQRAD